MSARLVAVLHWGLWGSSLLALYVVLAGCAKDAPAPPALPEEPVILDGYQAPEPPAAPQCPAQPSVIELTVQVCDQRRVKQARTRGQQARGQRQADVAHAKVIAEGLKAAEVAPRAEGYLGQQAIYRFVYEPGKIYIIYTHPSTATRLYFFKGDTVLTHPLIPQGKGEGENEQGWEYISARVGPEGNQQDVWALRPVSLKTPPIVTGVDLESGRSIYLRLVVGKTPMIGVTWDMPDQGPESLYARGGASSGGTLLAHPGKEPPAATIQADLGIRMPIELAQLHTAYKVEAKGPVGFMPTQVFDDGRKTLLKFKPIPGNMPSVFTYKPDGKRGLVYFTPYRVPNDPSRGTWYIVDGLWPVIELVATDGQVVRITRLTDVPALATQGE